MKKLYKIINNYGKRLAMEQMHLRYQYQALQPTAVKTIRILMQEIAEIY
jgi:hypothetical protein